MISVDNLGAIGIITDQQAHKLPANAFSAGRNVRFEHGELKKVGGYASLVTLDGQGVWAVPLQYGDYSYWITCSVNEIFAWDGVTQTNITRSSGDIEGSIIDQWNGGIFAGIAVLNNGYDLPQYWAPGMANTADLPGWDTTWRADVIRPYKNQLIAMQLTEGGVLYPTKYRWSNVCDPGSLPDWDDTDPASQAGSDIFEETQGFIVDGEALRDYFIIYKEDACYTLQYIGGQFVISNRMLLKTRGMLSQRCAKEFYGKHFVVSNGDVFVHDGQNAESVADGRVRRKIFDNLDPDNLQNVFVAPHFQRDEMWVCYPESSNQYANKAAIWNWKDNTWGFKDLPGAIHIAYGVIPYTAERTWDTATNTWADATFSWNQRLYNPADRTLVMLLNTDGLYPANDLYPEDTLYPNIGESSLYTMEDGWTADGAGITSYAERRGLKPGNRDGVFMLRAAYPRGDGSDVTLTFGSHDSPNAPVVWEDPVTFDFGSTSDKVDVRVTGRYFAFKVQFSEDGPGILESMDFDIVQVGTR